MPLERGQYAFPREAAQPAVDSASPLFRRLG